GWTYQLPDFDNAMIFFTTPGETGDVIVVHKQGAEALQGMSDKATMKELKPCIKRLSAAARRKGQPSVFAHVDPKLGFVALIREHNAKETIGIASSRGPVQETPAVAPRLIAYLQKASPPAERLRRIESYLVADAAAEAQSLGAEQRH